MSRILKPYEIYRHFKGNLYQILAVAEHSETGESLVIYQALYGNFKIYARPMESFLSKVDKEKYPEATQVYRFELQQAEERAAVAVKNQNTTEHSTVAVKQECALEQAAPVAGEEEELNIDPIVLQFLEADTYEERLNILVGYRERITDEMITTMAVACDVEVPEGSLEERYLGLKTCLSTLDKYECNRLR